MTNTFCNYQLGFILSNWSLFLYFVGFLLLANVIVNVFIFHIKKKLGVFSLLGKLMLGLGTQCHLLGISHWFYVCTVG